MSDHTEVPALTWTNTHPGRWVTDAPINGEDGAFAAVARRDDQGTWRIQCSTYGRSVGTAEAESLTDARSVAQDTYDVVEGVNR
jgi:hypothetical protein